LNPLNNRKQNKNGFQKKELNKIPTRENTSQQNYINMVINLPWVLKKKEEQGKK